ncbi:MAG TPA: hypothetical protein VNO55_12600, partial [Polyangia bacterium]|nr:hypothetical protein [Polyangia bacterium]
GGAGTGGIGTGGSGTGGSGTGGAGTGGAGTGGIIVDAAGGAGGKVDASSGGGDGNITDASEAGDAADPNKPALLSQTGLYADISKETLAEGVHAFQPQYTLWSDSATKRRWVYLPPGKKIDTSDMEFWQYPKGFKLWKEFTRDNVRVETRLLMKMGDGLNDWFMVAFKWRADKSDADAVPKGEMNASGTQHDIPSQEGCSTCHGSMWDNALGFSALQLSHNIAGSLNLSMIASMGWMTDPPAAAGYALPGTAVDKAALGYLHANCGMCHNLHSKVYSTSSDMDLWTHLDQIADVPSTRAYLSTVCDQWPGSKFSPITTCAAGHMTGAALDGTVAKTPKRVTPKNPAMSALHELMSERGDAFNKSQMPPVGSEIVDPTGIAAVDAWINKLP